MPNETGLSRSKSAGTLRTTAGTPGGSRHGDNSQGRSWQAGLQGLWENRARNGQLYKEYYKQQVNQQAEAAGRGSYSSTGDGFLLRPNSTINLRMPGDSDLHEHISLEPGQSHRLGVVELTVAGIDHVERIRLEENTTPRDIGITFSHEPEGTEPERRKLKETLAYKVKAYFKKWRGGREVPLRRQNVSEIVTSWVGAFLGILLVAALNEWLSPHISLALITAPFGASAVLMYGVPDSKLAQPRNVLGGHIIGSVLGCSFRLLLANDRWLGAALAMSLTLTVMQLTQTIHPPAGASAVVASTVMVLPHWQGFSFVLTCTFGSLAMLLVAIIINNLHPTRIYPTFWY